MNSKADNEIYDSVVKSKIPTELKVQIRNRLLQDSTFAYQKLIDEYTFLFLQPSKKSKKIKGSKG